ncbi:hypothetical protein DLAC_09180 [Tieghemostelium lacteum]|uniref:Uncharacterized protein n=1 Tax=Tieghemostelium lacteum TaxID=361077 RepID=A0A151Z9L2_TIELA|nr:hypothetical protein DLAC_09180 [Tieghemostelium lacteum]|eukprot:KYQ90554.1 hypothetical protein DLAC_09180 [Tieghemostelium lacteum]
MNSKFKQLINLFLKKQNSKNDNITDNINNQYFKGQLPNTILIKIINIILADIFSHSYQDITLSFMRKFMYLNKNIRDNVLTKLKVDKKYILYDIRSLKFYLLIYKYISFKRVAINVALLPQLNQHLITENKPISLYIYNNELELLNEYPKLTINKLEIYYRGWDETKPNHILQKLPVETLSISDSSGVCVHSYPYIMDNIAPDTLRKLNIIQIMIPDDYNPIVNEFQLSSIKRYFNLTSIYISLECKSLDILSLTELVQQNHQLEKFTFKMNSHSSQNNSTMWYSTFFQGIQNHPSLKKLEIWISTINPNIESLNSYLSNNKVLEKFIFILIKNIHSETTNNTINTTQNLNHTLKYISMNLSTLYMLNFGSCINTHLQELIIHINVSEHGFIENFKHWNQTISSFPNLRKLTIHNATSDTSISALIKLSIFNWISKICSLVISICKLESLHLKFDSSSNISEVDFVNLFQELSKSRLLTSLYLSDCSLSSKSSIILFRDLPSLMILESQHIYLDSTVEALIINNKTIECINIVLSGNTEDGNLNFIYNLLTRNQTLKFLKLGTLKFTPSEVEKLPILLDAIKQNQSLKTFNSPIHIKQLKELFNQKLILPF